MGIFSVQQVHPADGCGRVGSEGGSAPSLPVTCEETIDDPRHGTVVTVGTRYTFDANGTIGGFTYTSPIPVEVDDFHIALAGWMETEHPEAFETYFTPGFYSVRYESWQTPETVEELVPLIDEFVAQSDVYPLSP